MRIVAGIHKGRKLLCPKGLNTRPTPSALREMLFNVLQDELENAHVLDLCAGSGALSLEALSRGAAYATLIEKDKEALQCIRSNIKTLGVENQTTVIPGDVLQILASLVKKKSHYQLVFVDPPYDATVKTTEGPLPLAQAILSGIDSGSILTEEGNLFIEQGSDHPLDHKDLLKLEYLRVRKSGRSYLHHYKGILGSQEDEYPTHR